MNLDETTKATGISRARRSGIVVLFMPLVAQCTAEQSPVAMATSTPSPATTSLQCTTANPENSVNYQEYLLARPRNSDERSVDCRAAKQLIKMPSGVLRIIVRYVPPEAFKGANECDRAGFSPPLPDGGRTPLSEELVGMSFDTQIGISLNALSLPKCLTHVFPYFSAEQKAVVEPVGLSWLRYRNEKPGYDLSATEQPTEVAPVAVRRQYGKLQAVACAQFIYGQAYSDLRPAVSEIYNACLSNLSRITPVGDH